MTLAIKMRLIDCKQGSQEWIDARLARPTASQFSRIVTPSGKLSTSCEGYLGELLAEWVKGEPFSDFDSEWMERGRFLEPSAFKQYAFVRDIKLHSETIEVKGEKMLIPPGLQKVGFCLHDEFDAGCSPDGLVGDDGLIELKCPMEKNHIIYLFRDVCPKQYFMQVQGQLWVTKRQWCDFVSYHPDFPLFIHRVYPVEAIQVALDMWVEHFLKELELGKARLREYGVVPWTEAA